MKKYLWACGLMIIGFSSNAQGIRFKEPVKLSDHINSPYEESNPLLSPDGKVLYFVRTNDPANTGGDEGGQDIWYSQMENGQWSPARNDLSQINNGDNNAVVGIAGENEKLFLINTYSAHPRRDRGVVFTARSEGNWIAPRELDLVLKMKSDFYGFYVAPQQDILLISMQSKHSLGAEDLYVSFRNADSTWTEPLHTGDVINSEGYEISPFLSADGKTIYFASNGFDGLGGVDIYKSERLDDSWENWSKPVNMGNGINSPAFDAYFSIYEDKAFFASNRSGASADLYAIGIDMPEPVSSVAEAIEVEDDEEEAEPKVVNEKPLKPSKPASKMYIVYFDFDNADLSEEGKGTLRQLVREWQSQPFDHISITGHTDNSGSETYNQILSERRAEAVADFIASAGVEADQIELKGAGESQPINPNTTPDARKENRRVEVKVE